ncbi:hypothetical protein Salat_1672100 [Sesamum alatum]|uniref:DUF4283 domain-containing protein n=1 Tax=Sesamum alatum TaxID=300844 RepID=A0AAE1Y741_9LAMI|nr:hypothetical protein Salat_1672100 [Sesamum alatum]
MESSDLINSIADKTSSIVFSDKDDPPAEEQNPYSHFPIIAKILCDKPINSKALKSTLTKSWGIPSNTDTNQIEPNTVAFLLEKEEDRTCILRNNPWSFRGNLSVLQPWLLEKALVDVDLKKFQIWVQVSGLPVKLINRKVVEKNWKQYWKVHLHRPCH